MKLASFFVVSFALHGVILTLPISFFEQKNEKVVPVRLLLEKVDEVKAKPQAQVAKREPEKKSVRRPSKQPNPKPQRNDERQEPSAAQAAKEQIVSHTVQETSPVTSVVEKPVEPIQLEQRSSNELPSLQERAKKPPVAAPVPKPVARQDQAGGESSDTKTADASAAPFFQARYAYNPKPSYPDRAKREGWEGTVLLRVLIDPQGEPATIEINHSSGFDVLDQAAFNTVRRWRFHPAHHGDQQVASWVNIPIVFRLTGGND